MLKGAPKTWLTDFAFVEKRLHGNTLINPNAGCKLKPTSRAEGNQLSLKQHKKLVSKAAEPLTLRKWKNNLTIDFLAYRSVCVVPLWIKVVFIHGDGSLAVWTVCYGRHSYVTGIHLFLCIVV